MARQFSKGERIRVLDDNGRTGLIEYLGTVDSVTQTGVVVILDADPAKIFRMNMMGGFEKPHRNLIVRRFFNFGEIEKV